MRQIEVEIQGKTPLLLNRFTDQAAGDATSGTRGSFNGERGTPQEQAEAALYKAPDGTLIIPQPNIFRCLIDAGKYFKAGRSKVTTQKSSLVPAAVSMDEVYYDLQHEQAWAVDTRPVRIPATGGRILRHRPMFDDWKLSFEVELDTEIIGEKLFRDLVDAAGKRIGLGDFRPDCKGSFGKFVVTHWETKANGEDKEEAAEAEEEAPKRKPGRPRKAAA